MYSVWSAYCKKVGNCKICPRGGVKETDMIVIDGRESALTLSNYANLEEVLTKMVEEEDLENRIVTDVLVNNEAFSELYPHQAEDIEITGISRLEVRTVSMEHMAADILAELPKVIGIIAGGGRKVAALFRRSELAEAQEMLQDIVSVSRDFLTTVQVLRTAYGVSSELLDALGDRLGGLLGEMTEAMGNEDWMLVADLLEFEYLPACEGWRAVIDELRANLDDVKAN